MAEESWPWPGTTVGDAGPYTDDDWDNMWETLYGSGVDPYHNRGVIRNWLNELVVTSPGVNPVTVDTGAALVHGKFYRNTEAVIMPVVPSPGGGVGHTWREDLICVRSSWVGPTAQTIRIYRHQNPDDEVGYPWVGVPEQTDGTAWEIPLAVVHITSGGAITLTDLRDYVSDLLQTKHIFEQATYSTAGQSGIGTHFGYLVNGTAQNVYTTMQVPLDFKEIVAVYAIMVATVTAIQNWTVDADGGGCDELRNIWGDTMGSTGHSYTAQNIECFDITQAFDAAGLEPGMILGIELVPQAPWNIGTCIVLGVDFRYK